MTLGQCCQAEFRVAAVCACSWPVLCMSWPDSMLTAASVSISRERTYVCVRPQQDVFELRLLLVDVFDGLLGLIV